MRVPEMASVERQDIFWFMALVFLDALFLGATLNVQPILSPGDMGRDLYAFQQAFEGHRPCRDYWWQYGPLMPFYYAFWFAVSGVSILSVRMGLAIILLLCSLITYRSLRLFVSPSIAFLLALPYLGLDITHTFNHVGAFPFLVLVIFSLGQFFLTRRILWCYLAAPALLAIALVKISSGLASFAAFTVIFCMDCFSIWIGGEYAALRSRLRHLFFIVLIFGAAVAGIYGLMYRGLSCGQVDQCLTLTVGQRFRHLGDVTPWTALKHLIQWFLIWDQARFLSLMAFFMLTILGLFGLRRQKILAGERWLYFRVLGAALLMGLANAADYFVDGKIQRFDFWLFPMLLFLLGLLTEWAGFLFAPRMRSFLGALAFLCLLWIPFRNAAQAVGLRTAERYLDIPHGRVYLGGSLSDIETIKSTSRFIMEKTRKDDVILAMPYDPLYCFLSGRRHAVRELMFMQHMEGSAEEEAEIIREIEAKRPPLFLLSNRYRSQELGMGYFGETHYRKLAKYLFEHYREVQSFGPWDGEPAGLHAVKIFKRI